MSDPDLERPARVLDEVLARREFGGEVRAESRWLEDLLDRLFQRWGGAPDWLDAAILGLLIVGALLLVILILTDGGGFGRKRAAIAFHEEEAESVGRRRAARDLLREGRLALAGGRPGEAIALLFRGIVSGLVERGMLLDDPSRTNREHARDLRRHAEGERFARAVPVFERVRYGEQEPEAGDAERILEIARELVPRALDAAERDA